MTDDMRCLMALCRAGLLNLTPPPPPENADVGRVLAMAKRHMLSAPVAQAILLSDAYSGSARGAAKKALDTARYAEALQCFEATELFRRFAARGIDYCALKGWRWRELYPAPYDRDMNDVDVLVRLSRWEDACSEARACGFVPDARREIDLHTVFYKDAVKLELHRSLLSSHGMHEGRDRNVWDALVPGGAPHEWRLAPTDDYLYFFLHEEKHTASYEFALRMFTDIFFLRENGPKIDRARFEREAKRLRLLSYAENMEALSDAWMRGRAFSKGQEELLDILFAQNELTDDEHAYRMVRRWLALNLSPAALCRRLFMPRMLFLSRYGRPDDDANGVRRCIERAGRNYRMFLGEYLTLARRLPLARRRALNRAARRLHRRVR